MTKLQLEERSEQAALVLSLADEAVAAGLPADLVRTAFVDKWIAGDCRIDLEISSAMLDKSDSFVIRQLPTLKDLLDNRANNPNGDIDISIEESSMRRQIDELQES